MSLEAIVGAGVGLLGIAVTIWLYRRGTRHKRLAYAVVAKTPLLAATAGVAEDLEVRYANEFVSDVHLVTVAVFNSGTEAIRVEDFNQPLNLMVKGSSSTGRILTAEVRNPSPPDLGVTLDKKANGIEVGPLLMNRGDRFGIQMIAADFSGCDIEVAGRIADVTRIVRLDPEEQTLAGRLATWAGSAIAFLGGFIAGSGLFGISVFGGLLVMFTGYAIAGANLWLRARRQRLTAGFLDKPVTATA